MTKQGEIREGLYDWFTLNRDTNDADGVLRYLHSQGVVIKVDRELPRHHFDDVVFGGAKLVGYNTAQTEMLKAGYVAVEPLA